jgi:hypothetical protein
MKSAKVGEIRVAVVLIYIAERHLGTAAEQPKIEQVLLHVVDACR